ncbi:MAG: hypothetical protein ACE5IY_03390 [bacterium]
MTKLGMIVVLANLMVVSGLALAGEGMESAKMILSSPTPASEFRLNLRTSIATEAQANDSAADEKSSANKSIGKAVLFSAVVPGTGQLYGGSRLKGVGFLALEAIAIFAHFKYDSDGKDLERQFEAMANAEWKEDAYWDWMAQVSGVDRNNLPALREFENGRFSHFLPEKKNQQYYENVGKYNQFIIGWRDFREEIVGNGTFTLTNYDEGSYDGKSLLTISATRNSYTQLRKESNDDFKRATTFTTVALLNHVVSALDAGLTIKRRNRSIRARLGVQGVLHHDHIIPTLALGVTW